MFVPFFSDPAEICSVLCGLLESLWSNAELCVSAIKDDKLRLEENVTIDREPNAGVALKTSEAC
jgi:hypothetical protein